MSSNAVASSSKRPVPTSATQSHKRARPSISKTESLIDDEEMRDEEEDGEGDADQSARAKLARKEARVSRLFPLSSGHSITRF